MRTILQQEKKRKKDLSENHEAVGAMRSGHQTHEVRCEAAGEIGGKA
jgi:hypothetical protein